MIDSGPLRGLIGVIQEPPNADDRIKVLLRLINRPVNIDLPVAFIKNGMAYRPPELNHCRVFDRPIRVDHISR